MGNLLKVLTCTDLEQGPNFFLDFENAQPTESEKEIYNQVNVVLKDAEGILEDLQSYRGAGHEIREVKIPVPLFNLYCFLYCVVCFHSQSYLKEDYLHYFRSGCSDI